MQKAICSVASFFSLVMGERVSNRQTLGVLLMSVGTVLLCSSHPVCIILAFALTGVGYCFITKK
jgi:drug/metabolite transporter (DMT)-like permease